MDQYPDYNGDPLAIVGIQFCQECNNMLYPRVRYIYMNAEQNYVMSKRMARLFYLIVFAKCLF